MHAPDGEGEVWDHCAKIGLDELTSAQNSNLKGRFTTDSCDRLAADAALSQSFDDAYVK